MISGGWWFRVPVLFKTGGETVTVPVHAFFGYHLV
jgi:hypothetical protein